MLIDPKIYIPERIGHESKRNSPMKALLCKAFGPAETLVLEDIASPQIKKNEILLEVHAAGVNFPDTLIIEGKYQFKPPFPFSPGGEAAGVVAAVGEKVAHLKVGDRVMALTGWGSFAEQVAVPAYNVLPMPPAMDFNTAAAFSMTYGTSMHALKQSGHLQPGETLLVLGASGGVGLAAVEIGKAMGARVIAAASSAEKLAVAKNAGADELINYSEANLKEEIKRLTNGNGADVIYDPVGGDLFDQAIRSIAWNGRLLVVGFASGRIPELPVNLALLKGASVIGVFWGSFAQRQPEDNVANFQQLFGWYAQGKLKPLVSKIYPLEEAGLAIDSLGERRAVGKLVITLDQKLVI
jgi:NADPH2:quinone reductase